MSILQVVQVLDLLEKANWQPDEFEAEWHTFPPSGSPDEKVCEICQSMNGTSYRNQAEFDSRPHPNCRCLIHIFVQAGENLMEYWTEPPEWEG